MNIYLISQHERASWDTYDSAVVYAESEEQARNINPAGNWSYKSWASYPSQVSVTYIGSTNLPVEEGIILASFNAG